MKVKTSELAGPALDWAVAKCAGSLSPTGNVVLKGNKRLIIAVGEIEDPIVLYEPSTDWAQGGPIIERERLQLSPNANGTDWGCNRWAFDRSGAVRPNQKRGPTPLIAAMRCYVASKLGDEVEVPDALCASDIPATEG